MEQVAAKETIDFIINTGDNFLELKEHDWDQKKWWKSPVWDANWGDVYQS